MTKALARERHLDLLAKMGVGEIMEETTSPSPIDKQITELGKVEDMETVIGSEASPKSGSVGNGLWQG
jgi:hypothetical protein